MSETSIRTKGLLAFTVLVFYAIGLVAFVLHEKQLLIDKVEQLQSSYDSDGLSEQVNLATLRVLQNLHTQIAAHDDSLTPDSLRNQLTVLRAVYSGVPERYPVPEPALHALQTALDDVYVKPSMAGWWTLRDRLMDAQMVIGSRLNALEQRQDKMVDGFRLRSNTVAMVALMAGILAITLIGYGGGRFLTRMSRDLELLSSKTSDIVNRVGRADIPVKRSDELGRLSDAMRNMSHALKEREKAEEVERLRSMHQEKVSAIGTLANGIMHEIGNPAAAIGSLVHDMKATDGASGCAQCPDQRCDLIQQQLDRITSILRDVSEYTTPLSQESEVLDFNQLVDSACRLLRFDKRLAKTGCLREFDPDVPAIRGRAEQLTQLVISLLMNALDAVESVDRVPSIRVDTRAVDNQVILTVQDNGCGMDAETLNLAFDAFYTSKTEGKGSGLGLNLCQSIVAEHGGGIELESTPDVGTTVHILLPALSEKTLQVAALT